jgi:hypothetical protein
MVSFWKGLMNQTPTVGFFLFFFSTANLVLFSSPFHVTRHFIQKIDFFIKYLLKYNHGKRTGIHHPGLLGRGLSACSRYLGTDRDQHPGPGRLGGGDRKHAAPQGTPAGAGGRREQHRDRHLLADQ